MKKLVIICAISAALIGLITVAQAQPGPEPCVSVSVTQSELDLGSVPHPGTYDSPATLTLQVAANCPLGAVMAFATPLQHSAGNSIPPGRISIKSPVTGGFVSMAGPVPISQPTTGPGAYNINVQFQVEILMTDPAGAYNGTITFTITPPY
jgi:hypothetical protein